METKTRLKKFAKFFGYFFLFMSALFLIVAILLNLYLNKKVIEKVKEQLSTATNGEYTLSLDGLKLNLLTRTITVKNLIIAPIRGQAHSKAQYVFRAKTLRIVNFSIVSYLLDNDLLIDKVEFEEPEICIYQGSERLPQKKKKNDEHFTLYSIFSKKLNSVSIGQIDITNSKFNVYQRGNDTLSVFSSNDNSISIKKFNVSEETDQQNRLFVAEKFEIVLNRFSYQLGKGLYTLYGKSLYASYNDSTLIVDSLQLTPKFNKKDFGIKADRQLSRIQLIASKVEMQKMDVKLFFEYNWLVIHKIAVSRCSIGVYRDNTLPLKHIVIPSIQKMLKDLPFYVAVDTVELKDGEVSSEVLNPNQPVIEAVSIKKMNAIITGIQNDTSNYSEQSAIKIKLSFFFINKANFKGQYIFPLNVSTEYFLCSGSLTSMPLPSLNPLFKDKKHLLFKTGQLDSLSFFLVANENSSNGKMKFIYHDLSLEVLDKAGGKRGFKEKIKTFFANKLIVKESNPGKDGIVRTSPIQIEHNPYRSFIFYSMQSIISGIEPAITDQKRVKLMRPKK
jgi:hypothetical protein